MFPHLFIILPMKSTKTDQYHDATNHRRSLIPLNSVNLFYSPCFSQPIIHIFSYLYCILRSLSLSQFRCLCCNRVLQLLTCGGIQPFNFQELFFRKWFIINFHFFSVNCWFWSFHFVKNISKSLCEKISPAFKSLQTTAIQHFFRINWWISF